MDNEMQNKSKIGNAHILLVDDEEYLVKLWKRVIESKGYRVTSYTSGLQALEEFRDNSDSFDIVITDQSMPDITGLELAEQIFNIRSDTKIIICSGYFGNIDLNSASSKRIKEILLKPFDSNSLISAIEKVLINY